MLDSKLSENQKLQQLKKIVEYINIHCRPIRYIKSMYIKSYVTFNFWKTDKWK